MRAILSEMARFVFFLKSQLLSSSQRKSQPYQIPKTAKQEPLRVREVLSFVTRSECASISPPPFCFSLQTSSHSANPWRQRFSESEYES
ncbi:hypothetical protein OSB04_019591 [Centaurea solstitialis]|uniref:Uncharacterized protein n=1 Tax=Centaurea solstitialis TaxID=347529 RepID=A0AA38SR53_9ASTR|nr:hypothetical protein OSB04_019591 [Centaurea solstitialis]